MAKTELTVTLEKEIQKTTFKNMGVFGCLEVTIGWFGNRRVDFMTMDSKEIFRCYELKISKSDFHSKNGHNFVGHFNYYVMPIELYDEVKEKIHKEIGVYTWNGRCLTLTKRPKKNMEVEIDILKNSLIRSLYRETQKIKKSENVEYITKLESKSARLEREKGKYNNYNIRLKGAIYQELGRDKYNQLQEKYNL